MRVAFLLLLSISLSSCYNAERNCIDFKTGSFEFKALVGTELLTTTFLRSDSLEIDYFRGKADTWII